MKKIYSLVLMAAALLIGANAWAGAFSGTTRAELQAAIDGAASGTTLTLQKDVTLDGPIWLGTAKINDAAKSIELDLNGHNISMTASSKTAYYMFVLSHGELLVRNSSASASNISLTGKTTDGSATEWENGHFNESSQIFSVYGSYRSSRWNEAGTALDKDSINTRVNGYFSHLEIGERVNIIGGAGVLATAIAVDALNSGSSPARTAAKTAKSTNTIDYSTNINGDYGFAYGVRVDVKGNITMQGHDGTYIKKEDLDKDGIKEDVEYGYKCYGIKTNGNLASPMKGRLVDDGKKANTYLTNYNGKVEDHKKDSTDAPFVYVYGSASIITTGGSARSAAIYSSGYAKYRIQGRCEGNVGVYVKSGDVDVNDATIASTATTYSSATNQGGVSGAGSAIVVNSSSAYDGGISVNISGDTKVTADAGYAIEETVSATDGKTKVETVTIEGGTIEGGDKGAIIVSEATVSDPATDVTVYGATITGDTQAGASGDLTDLLPKGGDAHITTVTVDGKDVIVVSEGAAPAAGAQQDDWADVAALSDKDNPVAAAWTAAGTGTIGNGTDPDTIFLGELQLLSGSDATHMQVLTIKDKAILDVQHLMMNDFAQIVVEAGAKLIVEGTQGIVAPKTSNIILKKEAAKQAIFLFNPAVTSNRHPNATVEITTNSWYVDADHLQWECFGLPTHNAVKAITCEKTENGTKTVYAGVAVFENGGWNVLGYIGGTYTVDVNKLNQPFAACDLLAYRTQSEEAPKIKLEGELVGNTNAPLASYMKWTPFANSYSAEVDIYTMLHAFETSAQIVDPKTIYLAEQSGNGSLTWDALDIQTASDDKAKLQPMQAFLLNNKGSQVETNTLNYNSMVWTPATNPAAPAPARGLNNDITAKLRVFVANEEGVRDNVKLRESVNTSASEKYMNDDVNIYAMSDEKNAILAAEDLENTYLGFSTVKGGNFTISFAKVEGREFALLDHETGAQVAMVEGNVYEFTAAANTTNDYRFEIVSANKVATAIDNVEATKSVKGIYTITGQYVGEMNVWNSLPAGIYVVDGAKRVK